VDFLWEAEQLLIGHQATAVGFCCFLHKNGKNQLHLYFMILPNFCAVFGSVSVKNLHAEVRVRHR